MASANCGELVGSPLPEKATSDRRARLRGRGARANRRARPRPGSRASSRSSSARSIGGALPSTSAGHLAVDAAPVAGVVRVQVDPDRDAAGAARDDRIDVRQPGARRGRGRRRRASPRGLHQGAHVRGRRVRQGLEVVAALEAATTRRPPQTRRASSTRALAHHAEALDRDPRAARADRPRARRSRPRRAANSGAKSSSAGQRARPRARRATRGRRCPRPAAG